jgi:methionyl-tRNA formyltransferase
VSFFRLAGAVDSGTVHVQVVFDVDPRETATSLYAKVNGGIAAGIPLLLEQIESGKFLELHSGQPESYNFVRRPQDGFIDWSKSAEEIDRLVRASTRPYPGAFTAYKRRNESPWEKLILWSSDIATPGGRLASFRALPGQVLGRTDAGDILINAGKGVLRATEVQAAGQPAVSAKDFRIPEGARLGFQIADFASGNWQAE